MIDPSAGRIEIVPAVLPKNFEDLKSHLSRIYTATKVVQVDVLDGIFAKNKTWPYKDRETFDQIVEQEHGLPYWEEIDFEFDLMLAQPQKEALDFVHAGASRIVLHVESEGVVKAFESFVDMREESGAFSVRVGVAIPPTAALDILEPFESQFDFVQVMGINRVGFQNEQFDMHALYLVERLRHRYAELPIQVDGGVKLEHVQKLARAGANRLVIGSGIFGADDPVQALQELRAEANV